jgi:hypothetical protein
MDTKSGQSISAGVEMLYNYTIVNNSTERFVDEASDSFGPLGKLDLAAQGGSAELTRTQFVLPGVDNVFNNTLSVTGNLMPSGIACSAQDTVPLTVVAPVKPPVPDQVVSCSDIKPLTELSMVWNGENGTTVTTAAGQVFENLQQGNVINFTVDRDLYGNDFVVMLSGGSTGTSEFHLSCSDESMNGSDDCGTAQGNNKGDDDESSEVLTCDVDLDDDSSSKSDDDSSSKSDDDSSSKSDDDSSSKSDDDSSSKSDDDSSSQDDDSSSKADEICTVKNDDDDSSSKADDDSSSKADDDSSSKSDDDDSSSKADDDDSSSKSDDDSSSKADDDSSSSSKDDKSTLNNSWLLNGMSGTKGSFSCNLPNTGVVVGTSIK